MMITSSPTLSESRFTPAFASCAVPPHSIAQRWIVPALVRGFDVDEGMRVAVGELHQLPLQFHFLFLGGVVGRPEGMVRGRRDAEEQSHHHGKGQASEQAAHHFFSWRLL